MAIGREISATVTGAAAQGEGGSFRLRPRWPQKDQLEYVQQLVTVALLLLALAVFSYYVIKSPSTAVRMALGRVGMKP